MPSSIFVLSQNDSVPADLLVGFVLNPAFSMNLEISPKRGRERERETKAVSEDLSLCKHFAANDAFDLFVTGE